jgi:hypothetical protein
MKKSAIITVVIASLAGVSTSNATNLAITGVISQTVDTGLSGTTNVSGGSFDNTTTFATGTVGVFQMNGGSHYMRVTASNPTGALQVGEDALMVARTTNSQGLTDNGTLSIFVKPSPGTGSPAVTAWTLDFNFSFFADAGLTIAAPIGLQLTSLDIDYFQRYYVSNSSFTHNVTSAGTTITSAPAVAGYTGFTSGPDAVASNPNAAVASWGLGSSFDIRVGQQTNSSSVPVVGSSQALYMFEFRDPSSVVGLVPEPSSALLTLTGVMALGLKRRRQPNA